MRYFRNVDIVNEFLVNEATVRKWIRDTQNGRLDLALFKLGDRTYIADSPENTALIKSLVEDRRKYRNSRAIHSLSPISKLAGIWRNDYIYQSSVLNKRLLSRQYVRIYPKGNELIVESIPGYSDAYALARFTVDGNVATGTWQQVTDSRGNYGGAIYHGAAQLLISSDSKSIKGKWVGFGKNMEVKTGPWEFVYVGESTADIDESQALMPQ